MVNSITALSMLTTNMNAVNTTPSGSKLKNSAVDALKEMFQVIWSNKVAAGQVLPKAVKYHASGIGSLNHLMILIVTHHQHPRTHLRALIMQCSRLATILLTTVSLTKMRQ